MKDADLRRFLGLTWAGWLNCLILQWTGFRLHRVVESDGTISAWQLRWLPIWRDGWSLPTRSPERPGYLGQPSDVFVVSAEPGGVVTLRVTDYDAVRNLDLVVDRSFDLRSDLHCRSLTFGPEPKRGFWRRLFRRPAPSLVLTLAGHLLEVTGSMSCPPWGQIRDRRPLTWRQHLGRWCRARRDRRQVARLRPLHVIPAVHHVRVRLPVAEDVADGDLVTIDDRGAVRRGTYRPAAVGVFVTGAPAGGIATVEIRNTVDDDEPEDG